MGIPFWATALVILVLILLYTFEGGVKTIVYTDMLQTTFMLLGLIVCIVAVMYKLDLGLSSTLTELGNNGMTKMFNTDANAPGFFLKQIIGGAFITVAMTGLDQEMMQKNISVRTLKDSQKNILNPLKYNKIISDDIINISDVNKKSYDYIFFNSDIPISHEISHENNIKSKIIFITHSDVAYANYFIEKYHTYFYKIITVNKYTKTKLTKLINIDENKFIKLVNYTNLVNTVSSKKKYKFGIISRFSEDKNIPMLIMSLVNVFKKHTNYKFYLIGTHTKSYDDYLKYLCKFFNISKYVIFEGYQDNVIKYYELLDFIILPSVSEGCSYNIIEAMSFGLPVITSDVGGNHELIKNDENGIIYQYSGIREYEMKKIYITNYNEHLNIIGYFINNDDFKRKYGINNPYNTDVVIPSMTVCSQCNKSMKCINCNFIADKDKIFKINMDNITKSILKMINYNDEKIHMISENNKKFINENFTENIYIKSLISII